MNTKKLIIAAALGVAVTASSVAQAHGIWFAQRATQLALMYGIGADDLDSVKRFPLMSPIAAYGPDGKPVTTSLQVDGRLLLADTSGQPSVLTGVLDNGTWSKTPDGKWHKKGKDEVPTAVVSEHTYKYAVHIRGPLNAPLGALAGQTLQLVPVKATLPALLGQPITLRVLLNGKPVAGARVLRDFLNDPDATPLVSAADGLVTLDVRNQGLNVIAAMLDVPSDQPTKYNRVEHLATLSFVLPHAPE
jgi:nickel transport protein